MKQWCFGADRVVLLGELSRVLTESSGTDTATVGGAGVSRFFVARSKGEELMSGVVLSSACLGARAFLLDSTLATEADGG